MADPETTDVSPRGAARRARRRRTRRIATAIASVLGLALIVTTVVVVTGAVELPGAGSTVQASDRPPDSATTTVPPVKGPRHRRLTTDAPLRLWIAGDSLAGSIGPSLGELTADTGVVAPQYDSRVSSGLLNPNFYDWPKHAADQLTELDPEAVVFVVGTNDANVWSSNLAADYRFRTEAMMRQLVGKQHRTVYWVGPPVAKDSDLEDGVKAVAEIARDAASKVKGVIYVDAHALFDDENGDYQQSFDNELGERQVMRAGDGVHFSVDGADYISRAIFELLDRDWDISGQADPTKPQAVRETKGSTQVPGTHRSVSAGSSGTTTTTSDSDTTTTTMGEPPPSSSSTTSTTGATTTTTTTASPGSP
jgi:hypothetical protein